MKKFLLLAAILVGFQSCSSGRVRRDEAPVPAPAAAREQEKTENVPVVATWYGKRYHGRRTASGERFDSRKLTAAHPSLKFGTRLRVLNPANGREVVVRVNDRGPYGSDAGLDLSREAALRIGIVRRGRARVLVTVI